MPHFHDIPNIFNIPVCPYMCCISILKFPRGAYQALHSLRPLELRAYLGISPVCSALTAVSPRSDPSSSFFFCGTPDLQLGAVVVVFFRGFSCALRWCTGGNLTD